MNGWAAMTEQRPSPTVDEILDDALGIWGLDVMDLPEIAVAMGVVHGDFCRAVRTVQESEHHDDVSEDLRREIGNMILSSIRWANMLGHHPVDCIDAAMRAQRAYVERRKP